MKKITTVVATTLGTLALALSVTACGQKAASVTEQGTAKVKGTSTSPKPTAKGSPTEDSSPAPKLGDTVKIGDWQVRVVAVNTNAATMIHAANMFNDKPKGQYILVTYTAKYTGKERTADPEMDLSWSMTTPDQKVHDPASEVTPAEDQDWPTSTRTGGVIRAQEVFDLPAAQIKTSLLSVEDFMGDTYADFPLH